MTQIESQDATIKIIGIGSCGGGAINHMIKQGMQGVEFVVIDTDTQALSRSFASTQLPIDIKIQERHESHSALAVEIEDTEAVRERLESLIKNSDIVFIITGMGDSAGRAIAPMVAKITRELKILTVAAITNPFSHEADRPNYVDESIKSLNENVDSLIFVPQTKAAEKLESDESELADYATNEFMHSAVESLVTVLTDVGLVAVDLTDLSTIISDSGIAIFGTATATGTNRASIAAEQALSCLTQKNKHTDNVHGVLVNITHDSSFTMTEYKAVMKQARSIASETSTVIVCAYPKSSTNELRVAVYATGFNLMENESAD